MPKRILQRIIQIIFHPAKAWKEIEQEGYEGNIQTQYVIPLILLGTLSVVLGYARVYYFDVETSIKLVTISFLSYYVGFWVAAFLIRTLISKKYGEQIEWQKILYFTGYSFSVILATNIISGLVPMYTFFIKIFNIYTIFVVSQGVSILKLDEKQQVEFIIKAAIIMILCPLIIELLMYVAMPGMRL